ncbi:hypothetical protein GQ457_03G018520 [Hibiscus cannabinus]
MLTLACCVEKDPAATFIEHVDHVESVTEKDRLVNLPLSDCVEQISDSVEELSMTLGELKHLREETLGFQLSNAQTWVSVALTNEYTCLDGFEGVEGKVKSEVKRKMSNVVKITSNVLYMINMFDESYGWILLDTTSQETKGYYFFNPKENKVFVAQTRFFIEKEFLSNNGNGRNIELEKVQQQYVNEPEVEKTSQVVGENSTNLEIQPLQRSTRERHEPERCGFLITHGDVILVDQDEPKTYQEVVSSLDSEKWLEAMRSEMDSMSENQVWTLVEPPEGVNPIRCKWVFKKKTDMDGNVQTYKGRLVAKDFQQIHGVDYDETFYPVVMFKSIRILLAIAAFHYYEI